MRRPLLADVRRRFDLLRREVVKLVVEEDALGLVPPPHDVAGLLAANQRWGYQSLGERVKSFGSWLAARTQAIFASGRTLWERSIGQAFGRGVERARREAQRGTPTPPAGPEFAQGMQAQALRTTLGGTAATEKVELLIGRALADLQNVTEAMRAKMSRTLADGLVQGLTPKEVARNLVKDVDGIGLNRARAVATTELTRAHAEGQLLAFEEEGVEGVVPLAEWTAAGDACQLCAAMAGTVLKVSEARGMIPRHPFCQCAWRIVDESVKGKKHTKGQIDRAVAKSVKEETGGKKGRETRWPGADVAIDKARPAAPPVSPLSGAPLPLPAASQDLTAYRQDLSRGLGLKDPGGATPLSRSDIMGGQSGLHGVSVGDYQLQQFLRAAGKDPRDWTPDEAYAVRTVTHEVIHGLGEQTGTGWKGDEQARFRLTAGLVPHPENDQPMRLDVGWFYEEAPVETLARHVVGRQRGREWTYRKDAGAYQQYLLGMDALAKQAREKPEELAARLKGLTLRDRMVEAGKILGAKTEQDALVRGHTYAEHVLSFGNDNPPRKRSFKAAVKSLARKGRLPED